MEPNCLFVDVTAATATSEVQQFNSILCNRYGGPENVPSTEPHL